MFCDGDFCVDFDGDVGEVGSESVRGVGEGCCVGWEWWGDWVWGVCLRGDSDCLVICCFWFLWWWYFVGCFCCVVVYGSVEYVVLYLVNYMGVVEGYDCYCDW